MYMILLLMMMLINFHCIILSLCLVLFASCVSAFIVANGRAIPKKSSTPSITSQNNDSPPQTYSISTTIHSSAINSGETKIIDYENTITEDDNPLTSAGLSFIFISASDKSLGMLFCESTNY